MIKLYFFVCSCVSCSVSLENLKKKKNRVQDISSLRMHFNGIVLKITNKDLKETIHKGKERK